MDDRWGDARCREAEVQRRAGKTDEVIGAFEKVRAEFPQPWTDRAARERLAQLRGGGGHSQKLPEPCSPDGRRFGAVMVGARAASPAFSTLHLD